jgi:hypothetical protein
MSFPSSPVNISDTKSRDSVTLKPARPSGR